VRGYYPFPLMDKQKEPMEAANAPVILLHILFFVRSIWKGYSSQYRLMSHSIPFPVSCYNQCFLILQIWQKNMVNAFERHRTVQVCPGRFLIAVDFVNIGTDHIRQPKLYDTTRAWPLYVCLISSGEFALTRSTAVPNCSSSASTVALTFSTFDHEWD
jgi:hypothetical protein